MTNLHHDGRPGGRLRFVTMAAATAPALRPTPVKPVKIGGQALADGVFMRTDRAWAIARADGTLEVGELAQTRLGRVPVLRVVVGLASALALGVRALAGGSVSGPRARTGRPRRSRRVLFVLVGLMVGGLWLPASLFGGHHSILGTAATQVGLTALMLVALRVLAPAALWRYHGAEHKAVAAHEAGVDLTDVDGVLACPRVHVRCGTNLVFLLTLLSIPVAHLSQPVQMGVLVVLLGVVAEVMTIAANKPRAFSSRLLLAGGRFLQRRVTTAEPTMVEQAVGCAALLACLDEHARVTGEAPAAPVAIATASAA